MNEGPCQEACHLAESREVTSCLLNSTCVHTHMHTYIHSYPHTNQPINVKIQTISKYLLYTIVLIINIVLHHITNCYVLYTIYSITIYYIMAVPWLRKECKACSHLNQQQADLTCPLLSHFSWQKAILMIKQRSKTRMGKERRSSCVHESFSIVLQGKKCFSHPD